MVNSHPFQYIARSCGLHTQTIVYKALHHLIISCFPSYDFFFYHLYCAVPFRNRERITFDHLVSMKKPNETAQVRVLRDGEEHEFTITVRPVSHGLYFSVIIFRCDHLYFFNFTPVKRFFFKKLQPK